VYFSCALQLSQPRPHLASFSVCFFDSCTFLLPGAACPLPSHNTDTDTAHTRGSQQSVQYSTCFPSFKTSASRTALHIFVLQDWSLHHHPPPPSVLPCPINHWLPPHPLTRCSSTHAIQPRTREYEATCDDYHTPLLSVSLRLYAIQQHLSPNHRPSTPSFATTPVLTTQAKTHQPNEACNITTPRIPRHAFRENYLHFVLAANLAQRIHTAKAYSQCPPSLRPQHAKCSLQ
jgi:hypothetical protein